jgi:hypothetical protein
MKPPSSILYEIIAELQRYKAMAERALLQLEDSDLLFRLNPQQNSIAVIVRHMAGNMRSRFTDFLTTDGEKPDRNREAEFEERNVSRQQIMAWWEDGWRTVFDALSPLTDADLSRTVMIRNEPHTVFAAVNRQTAHYAYHVGQILLIAKHIRGEKWTYLSIPPGGSEQFNRDKGLLR